MRTLKLFKITYRESADSEPQETQYRGYDSEHAEERFLDHMSDEGGTQGLRVLSVTEVRPSRASTTFFNATR